VGGIHSFTGHFRHPASAIARVSRTAGPQPGRLVRVHPFEVLGQPIRRRIVEILAAGEHTAGTLEQIVCLEFGVTRSAVQHHLAYFKRNGWVDIREETTERWYRLEPDIIPAVVKEAKRLRKLWDGRYGSIDRLGAPIPRRKPRNQPQPSRRGLRGHGVDPDDPWLHALTPVPDPVPDPVPEALEGLHTPIEDGGGDPPRVSPGYM
jgi:DNA-binding transcriptional ArsR family regulator